MLTKPWTRLCLGFLICAPLSAHAQDRSGVRPEVLSLPRGPGSIQGLGTSFDPNPNTGSAGYSVGFEVPPGVGGLEPELALQYASGAGNGEAGIGWSLSLSVVERSTDNGMPRFDALDVITLRGMGSGSEELAQLADGSFRFRIEGAFVRGRQRSDGTWEFRNRSGVRFRFGQREARVASGARTFAWLLTEQEDTFGNRIVYSYEPDETGRPYLSRVIYNDFGPAYRNEVVLHWEPRPDVLTSHRAGFPVTLAQRLERVEVLHGGATVRSYELGYDELVGLSRLSRVEIIGSDGETRAPAVTFAYSPFAPDGARVTQMRSGPTRGLGATGELTDVDGDALPDVLVTDPDSDAGRFRWYPNRAGKDFGDARLMNDSPSVWLSTVGVELADMDGNGEADLVAKVSAAADGFRFYPAAGGKFGSGVSISPNPSFPFDQTDVRLLDLDQDRLTDWLRIDPVTGELSRATNRGGGQFTEPANLGRLEEQELISFSRGLRTADMNGDGLVDLVLIRSQSARFWPGQGSGKFGAAERLSEAPKLIASEEEQAQVRDLNGDGLSDLIIVGLHDIRYWLNIAANALGPQLSIAAPDHSPSTTVRVADMNGNGTADLVWIDPEGPVTWQYIDLLPEGTPGLLTRIDNGLGKAVTMEYVGMAQVHEWLAGGVEPAHRCPIGQMLLGAMTVSDGLGSTLRTEYRYGHGYYDVDTREFRGFALSEVHEIGDVEQPTLVTARRFDVGDLDEARKGIALSVERRTDGGDIFDRTENTVVVRELEEGSNREKVRFAFVYRSDKLVFEGEATPRTLRTEWDQDDYGNVTLESNYGEVCGEDLLCGDDETIARRTFAFDESAWIVDRLATERIEDGRGKRVAESRTYYDGEDFEGLALGRIERGGVSRMEAWLEDERFEPLERYARDEFGNVAVMLNARGGRREVDYDEETHTFVVAERQLSDSERPIEWRVLELNRGFGVVLEVEGPNGDITRFRHDALGRPVAIIEEGDSVELPTRSFEYSLGAPLSTVRDEQREESGKSGAIIAITHVDGLGRVRAELHEASREGEWVHDKSTSFGPRGWETSRSRPFFGAQEPLPPSWRERATSLNYDAIGRVRMEREPDGSETRIVYGALSRRVWDPNDADEASPHHDTPTLFLDDGQGRVRAVVERDGTREITTARYDYDPTDSLTRMEDAEGRVRTYDYDGRGHLVRVDDPNAGVWRQELSAAGDLQRRIDPTGRVVRYTHDLLGRVLEEWHTLPGEPERLSVRLHYDAPFEEHSDLANTLGRLAWAEDDAGAVFFGYALRGQLAARIRRWSDGSEHTTGTDFDAADRPVRRDFPDGASIRYDYDARGLLQAAGTVAHGIEYTAAGAVASVQLGDDVVDRRSYDDRDQLTRLEASSGVRRLRDLTFERDRASRITSLLDNARPKSDPLSLDAHYTYDDRYRLVEQHDSLGITRWTYDKVSNVLSVSSDHRDDFLNVSNTYGEDDAGPDRLTQQGDRVVHYDAAGRVVGDGLRTFSWDAKGRLQRVETANLVEEYVYGYDDERAVKRTQHGERSTAVHYIDGDVEQREGNKLFSYVFLGSERIAKLEHIDGSDAAASLEPKGMQSGSASPPWRMVAPFLFGLLATAMLRRRPSFGLGVCVALLLSCASGDGAQRNAVEASVRATYYLADHHGTTVAVLDAGGGLLEERAPHAYGAERQLASSTEPWGFAGNELDVTGLGNFHARAYDARLGRFLAVDPEPLFAPSPDSPISFQAYTYAASDPINLADPTGRSVWTKVAKVAVKVWKTGSAVDAFADNIKDALTVVNPAAPPLQRVIAGLSLASELLPVSVGDGKDAFKLAGKLFDKGKAMLRRGDKAGDAAKSASKATANLTGVGKYAGESIPARSTARDFTAAERRKMNEIGYKTGCHTCGTRNPGTKSGNFVLDHQDPSALNAPGKLQRLYPQCLSCSREQGLQIARELQQANK